MKTSELIGPALDWAVAKCEGFDIDIHAGAALTIRHDGDWWNPSSDWAQGGPIIEREGLGIWMYQWNEQGEPENGYYAEDKDGDHVHTGPTTLVAAMRCYVASKLGDEIDVPEGLTNQGEQA